jgi:hypothetical protein
MKRHQNRRPHDFAAGSDVSYVPGVSKKLSFEPVSNADGFEAGLEKAVKFKLRWFAFL